LIESLLQNYPVPSIFLYLQDVNGEPRYDVLDGKQRLETILMFRGGKKFFTKRFSARFRINPDSREEEWGWQRIQKEGHAFKFMAYEFQTVEVSGDFSDVIDLFVRINSTGKHLTSAEKRNAKFFRSNFLQKAGGLAEKKVTYFKDNKILSVMQISRMKHIELVSELLASIQARNLINKKKALDDVIGGQGVDHRSLERAIKDVVHVFNLMQKMFPKISVTRFKNSVDFYSLFMFVWGLDQDGCILLDAKRNKQAEKILIWLSNGVDAVRERQREAEGATPDQRLFADYLLTIQGDTDSLATRQRRAEILKKIFGGLFELKDEKRNFTPEQRRLLWNSDEQQRCPGCGIKLSWTNFTIDHIKPHALGGKSSLGNAALMCRSCNSRKGTKRLVLSKRQ
jgi:hypothetical protein